MAELEELVLSCKIENVKGTSLVVQWLSLQASTAGDMGLIPGQGTKIPHATHSAPSLPPKKEN